MGFDRYIESCNHYLSQAIEHYDQLRSFPVALAVHPFPPPPVPDSHRSAFVTLSLPFPEFRVNAILSEAIFITGFFQ